MLRRLFAITSILAGSLALLAGNFAIEIAARPPVPLSNLGLPPGAMAEAKQFTASLPPLTIVGDDPNVDITTRRVMLTDMLWVAAGNRWPWHGPQEIGDCVSLGKKAGIEVDEAVQIVKDQKAIQWRPVCSMWIYGGSRVTIGQGKIRGDGSVPSWADEFLSKYGILWADEPGVPPYSGKVSKEWGAKGPPKQFFDVAKDFKVDTFAACNSAMDVCRAINNGYPVPFASSEFGTDSIKLIEGRNVARDTGSWAHQQCIVGYDGTLKNGMKLFRVLNSWGPNAHQPLSQIPTDMPGGYYITWDTMEAICREGATVALSGTNGFPAREFQPDWKIIGQSGPGDEPGGVALAQQGGSMLPLSAEWQVPLNLTGFALLLLGVLLLLFVGNAVRRARHVAALAVLLVASPPILSAQDFQTLVRAATDAKPSTGEFPVNWSVLPEAASLPKTTGVVSFPACIMVSAAHGFEPSVDAVAKATGSADVVYRYTADWCNPCQADKRNSLEGDSQLRIENVDEEHWPEWVERGPIPAYYHPASKREKRGSTTLEELKAWASGRTAKPQAAPSAAAKPAVPAVVKTWPAHLKWWHHRTQRFEADPEPGTPYAGYGVLVPR